MPSGALGWTFEAQHHVRNLNRAPLHLVGSRVGVRVVQHLRDRGGGDERMFSQPFAQLKTLLVFPRLPAITEQRHRQQHSRFNLRTSPITDPILKILIDR